QPGQIYVMGCSWAYDVEISDLTLDCNYLNLASQIVSNTKSIGAVSAVSGHLNNVRAIHAGGTIETFTLGFCGGIGNAPVSSVLIENCRVEQSGPTVTAIFATDSQTSNNT